MAVILIADDETPVLSAMKAFLAGEHEILAANSAREAIEVSHRFAGTIDLVITNHLLPDGRGRDVAEEILRRRPAVKVLHVSGYPLEALVADNSLTPGAEFLQKPFGYVELRQKVAGILRR